jgi:hypothetical protein
VLTQTISIIRPELLLGSLWSSGSAAKGNDIPFLFSSGAKGNSSMTFPTTNQALSSPLKDADNPVSDSAGTQSPHPQPVDAFADSSEQVRLLHHVIKMLTEVRDLLMQDQIRDYYSLEEVAKMMGRAVWTVREWCRLGRVRAEKKKSGRGRSQEWVIPHAELLRIRREGLLPIPKH